jgi:lysophospholipase L1-like esterase
MGRAAYGQDHYVLNKGIPNNNVSNLLGRVKRSVLRHHPSLVIIMIGTNDMVNPPKRVSYKTYEENLSKLIGHIKTSGTDVLLLTLPHVDTVDLFKRHRRKKYRIPPNERIDSANIIIRRISKNQHCMFLDIDSIFQAHHSPNRTASSLIRNEKNAGAKDGVHPTPQGYQIIAESIAGFLKNTGKLYPKVICFGDSITFGAYVKGEGSTRGKTYPAVLKRLLFPK